MLSLSFSLSLSLPLFLSRPSFATPSLSSLCLQKQIIGFSASVLRSSQCAFQTWGRERTPGEGDYICSSFLRILQGDKVAPVVLRVFRGAQGGVYLSPPSFWALLKKKKTKKKRNRKKKKSGVGSWVVWMVVPGFSRLRQQLVEGRFLSSTYGFHEDSAVSPITRPQSVFSLLYRMCA